MNTTFKKIVSVLLTVVMLCGIAPVALLAQAASSTPTVQIVSFMRGAQDNLRSSELLEARVSGYDGNVQELTYKWTNTLETYLYIYNSHNMYSINNTDGEVEIYNEHVETSENMLGRSYQDTFTGKGYAWAAVYGASISGSSLEGKVTVEVYDKNGNFLCSDSHTGEYSNRRNKGFVTYNLDADMDNVVIGLFEGDKRNVKDLLGESAIVHITCTASKVSRGRIVEGAEHILLTTEDDGNYYITGTNAGTSTGVNGDAQVDLTIKKENCKFHNKQSGSATTTVFVFKKPTTSTTTTTLTLTGNLDDRCDYFIAGTQGKKQADGTILFTGLTPNTAYAVEVRGEYTDKNGVQKYAYAYVYDTTKPVYLASVYTYLDGALTDIAALHGEEVALYLLDKDEDATLPGANFIALSHSATGTYTATVENGIYYPWHDDGPEYHLAREYKLVVENANGDLHLHHYSVNYDTNGGAFRTNENPGTEIFASAKAVNATTKVPVRDGYVFAGWKYGTTTYAAGAQVTNSITAPMTLVAQWEKEVNVTINVTINHKVDGGFDSNENKDELTVDFLEMKEGSPAFVETGDRLFFSKEGVTDEKGNVNGNFEYSADVQGTAVLETRYTAIAPTYTGLLETSTFGVALSKSGYDVGVIEKIKDENGNWTINIPLTYNPDDFDLEFSVEMADDVPKELYPDAVIVKVACWDADANEWVIITQQRTTEITVRPGIRVDIDKTTGEGSGSYPVWKHDADGNVYGYRAVVTGFIYGDSTIIVPTEKDHAIENGNVIIAYTDGNYTATMGSVSDGQKFGTYLNGAYYNGSTDSQAGTLDAVITVEKYNVTFDAQGGKVNGNNTQTVADQYYIPDFDSYQPVMEDHNFLGWYLDKDCTIPATEGTLLVEDVTVYAKWDRVLTGELIVDGYYTDSDGVQHVVDITSRAKHALVELEEITPDGTYNIDGQVVEISWTADNHFSEPSAYMFKGLDPDKTYRIDVYLINYDAIYQNSTTVINGNGDIHDDYNENDYTAVYTDENKLSTFVNVFMHFEPEEYFQPVEVDASRIGEGFRPENTLVEYHYSMNVDSDYSIITQHKSSPFGVSVNMNGDGYNDGVYGCEVWNEVYNGTLYDYQANLTKIDGKDLAEWPVIVTYGAPARYSPLNDAPTSALKVEIIPMWYNVIYDLNTAADDSDRETVFSGHIWSYESVLDYTPVRDGYVFGGWYSDEACTDGNEVTTIAASVHEDTLVFAKWEKRTDLELTVNHVDKLTNNELATETKTAEVFGTVYTAESLKKTFKGYSYDSASAESVTITTGTNEITLYYTINSYGYTVNYLEKGTDKVLAAAKTGTAVYNQTVTETAVAITGYNLVGSDSQSIVIDTENNVITFYYSINSYGYTVNYLEKGTNNVLATAKTGTANYNQTVTETAPAIKGYNLVGSDSQSIVIDTENNVITFYYTINSYGYTVNYLEKGTDKVLAAAKTGTANYNQTVTETALAITGYNLVGSDSQSIVIDTENNVINFYYSINSYGYTVNYLEQGTDKVLAAAKTGTANYNQTVTETAVAITGYNLVGENSQSIVIDTENNVITFYYSINSYGYTVNYLEKGTDKVLAAAKTGTANYNQTVTETAIAITGYNLVGADSQSIVIDTENNSITFFYAKKNDLTLTVKYVDKATNSTLAADTKTAQVFGTVYTAESLKKTFTGYTYDSASAESVTITTGTNEITLYYTINSYGYTVNYLEQGTDKVLATAKTGTANYNQTVTETAPAIKGYNLVGENSQSIVIDTENNVITFYYTINSYGYTVNYLEKGTDKVLAAAKTGTANYNQTVTETAPAITGYNLVGSDSQSIVIDTENNVITFYYTINSYGYTVNYLEKGTDKVLAAAKTGTAVYNQTVTENAVAITGYNLVGSDSQSIVIDTENNVINFYYAKQTYSLTVAFIDKATGDRLIADKKINNLAYGEIIEVSSLAADIAGYKYVESVPATITITSGGNSVYIYYEKAMIGYSVEYYYDNVLDSSKTENMTALYQSKIYSYEDKGAGYILGSVGNLPLTIGADASKNVIRVYYFTDKVGGGEFGTTPDSNPDIYQKQVIFRVVNGTWADTTTRTIVKYVNLKTDGRWDVNGSATITAPTGMIAVDGYHNGSWNKTPPTTVRGTDTELYVFTFKAINEPETPENPEVSADPDYSLIPGTPGTKQHIVFGKTEGIGWYRVSKDGGKTYDIVFGNSTYEVNYGDEIIISVGDLLLDLDSYAFFVNEQFVPADKDGNLVITVKGYMLIRALGYTKLPLPDTDNDADSDSSTDNTEDETPLNWFQRIIKAIREFFEKLFGIKK